jgi:uncharacterized SAM-binding protein YcdF (DUF218 family)
MKNWFRRFSPVFLAIAFAMLLALAGGNDLIIKKVVAHLILPAGFLWLIGFGAIVLPSLKKSVRSMIIAVWLLYSLAGSPYLGVFLLRPLERPFYSFEEPQEKLDALVLLGGGTALSPGGLPSLATHGDRILRPATLYHQGLVGTLITTGRSVTEAGEDRLLSEETSKIWQGLGIPGESIVLVSEPRNTREELAAVAELMKSHPEWRRVGLCTSASHLRRAMKEARSQQLDLIPIPCDFRSGDLIFSPMYLVPQGRGFRDVQTALWEYLGGLF